MCMRLQRGIGLGGKKCSGFPILVNDCTVLVHAVLPDYFLEIPRKKSINSPFTTQGIFKFPKYLIETWLKIPHSLLKDLKKFPTERSFSPPNGEFPPNLATLRACWAGAGGER
jgi:hypothetical protein